MVSVFFGMDRKANFDPDGYFRWGYYPEWFDDDIVKQMVLDVDKTVVKSQYCMESPVLGQIPPDMLSGGVKGLILLYKDPDYYTDISIFGENCQGWLSWLFQHKDIKCSCCTYDLTFRGYEIQGICENDGRQIKDAEDWVQCQIDFIQAPESER